MRNWIEFIKSDADQAIKELYLEHRDEAIAWMYKNYKTDPDQASEIFQIAIVILYDNVMQGKLSTLTSSIKSYLFAICKNKLQEAKRKHQKEVLTSTFPTIADLESDGVAIKELKEEKIRLMEKGLHFLGDPCKSILQLFYYQKLKMNEITTLLSYKNIETTKNLKYKCMKRLQTYVSNHQG